LGVDVRGITFDSGFFHLGQPGSRCDEFGRVHPWVTHVEAVAAQACVPLEIVDVSQDFYRMLLAPAYGYGAHVNPCIDCKILFLRKALARLQELGGDFLITGEVSGQRPMSQNKTALDCIERRSGCHDILLRPLSALCLEPTKPEREGLSDRQRLLRFSGRTRKPQMELAARLGIQEYAQPAGGCVLTEENFSLRFQDFRKTMQPGQELTYQDITRLRLGRHFRLAQGSKIIVGRNEQENAWLEQYRGDWGFIQPFDCKGPAALVSTPNDPEARAFALGAAARYSDVPRGEKAKLEWHDAQGMHVVEAVAWDDEQLTAVRL
jgi:tRNA U34 2-thiouridine synthase MnmA/TrmU